jgi:hypothetical protein
LQNLPANGKQGPVPDKVSQTLPTNKKKGKITKYTPLKVHKIENFFDSEFGICVISLLGMSKY